MNDLFIIIIGIILGICLVFGLIFIPAYFEARTFNKFSEKKATTIDAVFGDLRIEACRNN